MARERCGAGGLPGSSGSEPVFPAFVPNCLSLSGHNTPDCHSAAGALKAANRGDGRIRERGWGGGGCRGMALYFAITTYRNKEPGRIL